MDQVKIRKPSALLWGIMIQSLTVCLHILD